MHAIILAAGRGTRLQGLTADKPKCLVEFHGKPLLAGILQSLRDGGCTSFTIVAGYQEQKIREFVAARGYGVEVVVNAVWETTNMVQSLLTAGNILARRHCVISYSDIFYSPAIVADLIKCDGTLAISYDEDGVQLWRERFADPLCDIETFRLNHDGSLAEIGGTVVDIDGVQGQYMGLLRFEPLSFARFVDCLYGLPKRRQLAVSMTEMLSVVLRAGMQVTCVPNRWPWGELDTPADIAFFERRYARSVGGYT